MEDIGQCVVRHYRDGKVEKEVYCQDKVNEKAFAQEFKPGDKLELTIKSTILFSSQKYKDCVYVLSAINIYANKIKTDIDNNFYIPKEHTLGEFNVVKDPECTVNGEMVAVCINCGFEQREIIPAIGHDYEPEVTVDTEPTCGNEGSKSRHCTRCDSKTEITAVPATGKHNLSDYVSDKNSKHTRKCQNMNCTYFETVSCDFGSWRTVNSTCSTVGYRERTCNTCSYTEKVYLDLTPHTPGEATEENLILPTCTKEGSVDYVIRCTVCSAVLSRETVKSDKLEHQWELTDIKEATCKEEGENLYSCKLGCGHIKTEQISINPENHSGGTYFVNSVNPTCEEDGYEGDVYCKGCDKKLSDGNILTKLGHSMGVYESDDNGEHTRICKRSNCTYSETEPCKLGEWIISTGWSCTAGGSKQRACEVCKYIEIIVLPPKEHTPGDTIRENDIPADCETDGSYDEAVYCVVCSKELSRISNIIEKLGHEPVTHTQPASCEVTGYVLTNCARCYEELSYEELPKLGHDWDKGIVSKEATCIVKEEKLYTCKRDSRHTQIVSGEVNSEKHVGDTYRENEKAVTCIEDGYTGDTYCSDCKVKLKDGEVIEKLGHDMSNFTSDKNGKHISKCKRTSCTYSETKDCTFSEWKTIKESDCTVEGEKERICTVCSYKETEKLPLKEHTSGEAKEENRAEPTCDEEGSYDSIIRCTVCEKVLSSENKKLEKLGHDMGSFASDKNGKHTSKCKRTSCTYSETKDCTFSEWKTVKESDCTVEGEKERICTVCSYKETEKLPLKEHASGEAKEENRAEPTCDEEGSYDSVIRCTVCEKVLSSENKKLEKLGHSWDDGVVVKEATCIVKEEKLYTCKRDSKHTQIVSGEVNSEKHVGDTYLENEKAVSCTEDGYTGDTYCSNCKVKLKDGEVIGKLGHDMGQWYKSKEPTLLEEGQERIDCKRCEYNETRSIPRLEGKKTEDPETGVSVEYTDDSYDEDITVKVEEEFDGSQYLTQQYTNIKTWNIKTYVGDTEVQPDVPVVVRIPLPEDYNASTIAVFHINSETGKRERVEPVIIENGYICFYANSFSVYIIVDESSEIKNDSPVPDTHKHTEVILPAVKATYTTDGLTEGKKCSTCGAILVAQKKVARKKLKKVSSLKVKKTSSTYVTLSWKKVTGADSYKVYYSTNGKKWKSVKVKKNTATIKKLKSGTQYRFKVRAFAGKYYGSASKVVKKTTKVKKPTLSSVKSSKKKTAVVTWKKVTNANGYVVEYSTSKKFTKKTTKTVKIKKGKTVKTTLKKLKSGKKYYVRVKAYKTVNKKAVYGGYSKVKTVKVK